jgi:hypothetical protein
VAVLGSSPAAGDDGVPVIALVLAIVGAFVAGAVVTGAFFVVRDR